MDGPALNIPRLGAAASYLPGPALPRCGSSPSDKQELLALRHARGARAYSKASIADSDSRECCAAESRRALA
eukprot:3329581-Pleurochrysis_carterae.AAC.4